jgi:hypothetical protein
MYTYYIKILHLSQNRKLLIPKLAHQSVLSTPNTFDVPLISFTQLIRRNLVS